MNYSSDDGTLEMFAEFEAELEKDQIDYIKYREVLQEIVRKIGKKFSFEPTETESAAIPGYSCSFDSAQAKI